MQETDGDVDRAAGDVRHAKSSTKARGIERQRYQFEAGASDDELENETDENLIQLGGLAGSLKSLAMAADQQVDVRPFSRLD